jgi:shikimate dehydrogenase
MPRPSTFDFRLGLIGYPLGHSLSPKIHAAALDACGLEGEYALYPIVPDDSAGLKNLLARVRSGEIHGLNVTIPHKQNVIPLLDELTPTAQAIGAVNTIYFRNDHLIGDNTDAPGFLADLRKFLASVDQQENFPSVTPALAPGANVARRVVSPTKQSPRTVRGLLREDHPRNDEGTETPRHGEKNALVLGAGGSARAVVYALVNDGWHVTIAARREEQAHQLAASYSSRQLQITNYEEFIFHLSSFILVINATPLGMTPNTDASPWPENLSFPRHAAIYDLVYNPRETKLVRDARAASLPATTGLGMLIEQAALAFEMWTGYAPPRDTLFAALGER